MISAAKKLLEPAAVTLLLTGIRWNGSFLHVISLVSSVGKGRNAG